MAQWVNMVDLSMVPGTYVICKIQWHVALSVAKWEAQRQAKSLTWKLISQLAVVCYKTVLNKVEGENKLKVL